jgi:ActR/RegA family two-component response regulator
MPELVLLDDDRRQFTALSRACVGVGIRVHRAGSVVEAVSIARRVNRFPGSGDRPSVES